MLAHTQHFSPQHLEGAERCTPKLRAHKTMGTSKVIGAIHQVCTMVDKAMWANLDIGTIVNIKRRNCSVFPLQFTEKFCLKIWRHFSFITGGSDWTPQQDPSAKKLQFALIRVATPLSCTHALKLWFLFCDFSGGLFLNHRTWLTLVSLYVMTRSNKEPWRGSSVNGAPPNSLYQNSRNSVSLHDREQALLQQ